MSRSHEPRRAAGPRTVHEPSARRTKGRRLALPLRGLHLRALLCAAAVAAGVGATPHAHAQGPARAGSTKAEPATPSAPSTRHSVAVHVEGAGAGDLADTIAQILPATVDVVPSGTLNVALAKQGQKLPFGLVISLDRQRKPVLLRVSKALESLGAEAMIVGFVRPRKQGGREVLLLVLEPGRDTPSVEVVVALGAAGKPAEGTRAELEAALAEPIEAWKPPPPPPEPEPVEAPTDPEESSGGDGEPAGDPSSDADRPANVPGHEILDVSAAFDLAGRFFDYNDGLGTNLRDYSTLAPAISGRLEVYPLATTSIPVLEGLGVYGEVRGAVGLSSATSDGTTVDTSWLRLGGGLRLRMPFGDRDAPFVLGLRGGFAHEAFSLEASGELGGEVPSVAYTFLRGGLDARLPLGPVAILLEAGYLGALDAGEMAERFREPTLGGIDVGGGLAVPIAFGFEGRLKAQYVRWFYAFAPIPGDSFVAGGALDEYLHVELGPAYVY